MGGRRGIEVYGLDHEAGREVGNAGQKGLTSPSHPVTIIVGGEYISNPLWCNHLNIMEENMGAIWDVDEFVEGGLKGLTQFIGTLEGFEDDVEGKYGTQVRLDFVNVEIIESVEPIKLDNKEHSEYIKQGSRKNSVNQKMVADWTAAAKEMGVGPIPSCFFGKPLMWTRATYDFGEDMTPGTAFVPSALGVDASFAYSPAGDETVDVPEALEAKVLEVLGDEGANADMVRGSLARKKSTREALAELGGIDVLMASLVVSEVVSESDGLFTVA